MQANSEGSAMTPLRLICYLPLAILLGVLSSHAQQPESGESIYKSKSESVFLLVVQDSSGEFPALGSGFLISQNLIATNAHVSNAGKVYLQVGPARIPTTVQKTDSVNDLAILKAGVDLTVAPLLLADDPSLRTGQVIYAMGNPEGLERTISQGILSGIRDFDGRRLYQITAPISHGSSGGPIFNSSGKVIAVAVASLKEGQNLNFAVPVKYLLDLMKSAGSNSNAESPIAALESESRTLSTMQWAAEDESEYQLTLKRANHIVQEINDNPPKTPDQWLRVARAAITFDNDAAIVAAEHAKEAPGYEAHMILARAYDSKGLFSKESGELFAKAEKEARQALRLSDPRNAETRFVLGDVLTDEQKYSEAAPLLVSALQLGLRTPSIALAYRDLLVGAGSTKDVEAEKRWFDQLVATGEASGWDWENHANRLQDQFNKYAEGAKAHEQAAVTANYYKYWCNAIFGYWVTDDQDSTLRVARKCVESGVGKKNSESDLAYAHRMIADVLNSRGVFQESLNEGKESVELDSSNAWAYDEMATALLGLRRFSEAVNASQQAIRLSDGKFSMMHFHLGSSYFNLENYEIAKQSYQKAAELDKTDFASAYNVGLCLHRLHYFHDAADWYEEALRRDPSNKKRGELLDTIRLLRTP
jgi:S1-C subfamily serine protease/Flp pilus assembly protein TadD